MNLRFRLMRNSPALAVGVAAMLVAGCGAASNTGTNATAANVALATRLADASMRPVTWTAPGPAIPVGQSLSGDKVVLVANGQNQFTETAGAAMKQAGAVAGVSVITDYTDGTLTAAESGIQEAITVHAKAIALMSFQTSALEGPIKAAIAAGIPVIQMGEHDPGPLSTAETAAGVASDITACYSCAGADIADFIVSASKGKAHVLFINSPDIGDATSEMNGFQAQMTRLCPACTVQTAGIPIPDWATQIAATVSSAITAHPDINYIVPVFDVMSSFVTPAIKAANATTRVKLASFNASSAEMVQMQSGATPAWLTDGGFDLTWFGWNAMDDIFRSMLKKPALASESLPLRFFTSKTVGGYDFSGAQDPWYGNPQYVRGYTKLWGISG